MFPDCEILRSPALHGEVHVAVLAFPDAAPHRLADVASFLLVRADEPGPLAARPFTGEVREPPRMVVRREGSLTCEEAH